jgi:hypothetical protein
MEASLISRQSDDRGATLAAVRIEPANDHCWPLCAFTACPVCGAELPPDLDPKARRERVYCSDACRARAWQRGKSPVSGFAGGHASSRQRWRSVSTTRTRSVVTTEKTFSSATRAGYNQVVNGPQCGRSCLHPG